MTRPLTHLGTMPIEEFLRDYWQKKPLLIRQALPTFESPISPDELAGLALEEDVESRLVLENGKTPWELRNGPFDEETFTRLPEKNWTLLVQAVDQWVPEVNLLLDSFRFIPNWRLDDIMVSYATDGGGVGPHFDYYDVFLLQGLGKRRWKIGQMCDATAPCVDGTPLKILNEFHATDEWILEPGDMLYIPPGLAHWGSAHGDDCMTYSIGFRAPSHGDILGEIGHTLSEQLSEDLRYSDPNLTRQTNPGEISPDAIAQLQHILQQHLTPENISQWFGRYMTERKYLDSTEEELEEIPAEDWQAALAEGQQLWRHPAARLAFHSTAKGTSLFADGEAIHCSRELAELVCAEPEISWAQVEPFMQRAADVAALSQLINQETLLLDE